MRKKSSDGKGPVMRAGRLQPISRFALGPAAAQSASMSATSTVVTPAMLLPGVVLFPHALLPLHLFEPRYREMLEAALATDRAFAIAGGGTEDDSDDWNGTIATVGIVRDRRHNPDGTSDLVLQGSWRGRILKVDRAPFPRLHLKPLLPAAGGSPEALSECRQSVLKAARRVSRLGGEVPRAIIAFLNGLEEPDIFADTASHLLFDDLPHRLRLLSASDTLDQLTLLASSLEARAARRTLEKLLPEGGDDDDSLCLN